ncbi:hypothetical protein F2Q70_00001443 [Brassica cretica]|uniref:Uncharacterized protein n=1 Tax=Brassica cretica TaxID=69181 RepID=A0A8S9IX26_BRACR|nr:hypothetical protein F2Q70_00001443 [Brassica cretica]
MGKEKRGQRPEGRRKRGRTEKDRAGGRSRSPMGDQDLPESSTGEDRGNIENIREKSGGGPDVRVTISEDKAETESVAEKGDGTIDKEVGILVGGSGGNDEDMGKISEQGVSEKRQEKAWEEISPGKASCTPNKLKFGQVSIRSKSRFSVLSAEEEEGEVKENQESLEVESSDEDKHSEEDKELEDTLLQDGEDMS